jgi:hypothetical protein
MTRSACTMVCLRSNAKVSFVVTVSNAAHHTITDLSEAIGKSKQFTSSTTTAKHFIPSSCSVDDIRYLEVILQAGIY